MLALLQTCFVIVTIAVVAIAVAVVKEMRHFRRASDECSKLAEETRQWIDQLRNVTRDAGEVVGSIRDVVPRLRRVVDRFESIGERTAGLWDALLREVEVPVRTAVAVARGVRLGSRQFLEGLARRLTGRPSSNGKTNCE